MGKTPTKRMELHNDEEVRKIKRRVRKLLKMKIITQMEEFGRRKDFEEFESPVLKKNKLSDVNQISSFCD